MNDAASILAAESALSFLPQLPARLRQVLDLAAALRAIRDPLTDPESMRAVLEALARLAEIAGMSSALVERLRGVAGNPALFELVLAVARFLSAQAEHTAKTRVAHESAAEPSTAAAAAEGAADYLYLAAVLALCSALERQEQGR